MVRLLTGLIAFALVGGCGTNPEADNDERSQPEYDFADYRAFVEELAKADSVVVFEGLPGDFAEPELYAAEIAKKIHVSIDGFEFYTGAKALDSRAAAEITNLFSKEGVAVPYGGPKTCGAFHPDFMAEWTVGTEKFRAHVCYGCHEIRAIGPGIDTFTDISDSSFPILQKTLRKFQNKRPVASTDETE